MAYTNFGKLLQQFRRQHDEIMGDMADWLGVKPAFLSAVENGKKNAPEQWLKKITEHYSLSNEEQKELHQAWKDSKTQVKLNLVTASDSKRMMASCLARSFSEMDDETAKKIIDILYGKD